MGHSLQAVSLLVHAAQDVFAVPLAMRIHEGLVWSNRDKRTLLDKMLDLLRTVSIETSFYFVADAYYAAGKVVKGLLIRGHHLMCRIKSNAVACLPVEPTKGKRREARPGVTAKRSESTPCFLIPERCRRLPVPFMARTRSCFAFVFATCCGVLPESSSASWPSCTPPGELSCSCTHHSLDPSAADWSSARSLSCSPISVSRLYLARIPRMKQRF